MFKGPGMQCNRTQWKIYGHGCNCTGFAILGLSTKKWENYASGWQVRPAWAVKLCLRIYLLKSNQHLNTYSSFQRILQCSNLSKAEQMNTRNTHQITDVIRQKSSLPAILDALNIYLKNFESTCLKQWEVANPQGHTRVQHNELQESPSLQRYWSTITRPSLLLFGDDFWSTGNGYLAQPCPTLPSASLSTQVAVPERFCTIESRPSKGEMLLEQLKP